MNKSKKEKYMKAVFNLCFQSYPESSEWKSENGLNINLMPYGYVLYHNKDMAFMPYLVCVYNEKKAYIEVWVESKDKENAIKELADKPELSALMEFAEQAQFKKACHTDLWYDKFPKTMALVFETDCPDYEALQADRRKYEKAVVDLCFKSDYNWVEWTNDGDYHVNRMPYGVCSYGEDMAYVEVWVEAKTKQDAIKELADRPELSALMEFVDSSIFKRACYINEWENEYPETTMALVFDIACPDYEALQEG